MRSELLSRALDADIWLKYETATPIASFKIRGALNAAVNAKNAGTKGVVTSSTGNHGQGVAYAARLLGMTADIFLPRPANRVKAQMIEAFGGTVHEVGDNFELAKAASLEYAAEQARIGSESYPFDLSDHLDWEPMIRKILEEKRRGVPVPVISNRFHRTLAVMILSVAEKSGVDRIVLTGGCFQNKRLLELSTELLEENGFRVYWHQRVPPNDGGLCLGQIYGALHQTEAAKCV